MAPRPVGDQATPHPRENRRRRGAVWLPAHERGQVDAWIAALGLTPGTVYLHWRADGSPDLSTTYGTPDQISVYCHMNLTADADAHWSPSRPSELYSRMDETVAMLTAPNLDEQLHAAFNADMDNGFPSEALLAAEFEHFATADTSWNAAEPDHSLCLPERCDNRTTDIEHCPGRCIEIGSPVAAESVEVDSDLIADVIATTQRISDERVAEIVAEVNAGRWGSCYRDVISKLAEFQPKSDVWTNGSVTSFALTDGRVIARDDARSLSIAPMKA